MLQIMFMIVSCEIILRRMPLKTFDEKINIYSGNGLVLSGKKPLPEPMLTPIYVTIWNHQDTVG